MRTETPETIRATVVIVEALSRLAIARAKQVDEVELEVYADALGDLDPALVQQACLELGRLPRREYDTPFPSVGTIRERADTIRSAAAQAAADARLLPAPKGDEDAPRFFCLACFDEPAAWRVFWCRGSGLARAEAAQKPDHLARVDVQPCGRGRTHGPHTYTNRCTCRDTNPVIAEHRRRQRQSQQTRKARRKGD